MSAETIDSLGSEVTRTEPREYRKVAVVKAGQAIRGGIMATLEGDHTFEEGDYICGPGAGGEFWPVKRAIFEATYVLASEATPVVGLPSDDEATTAIAALQSWAAHAGMPHIERVAAVASLYRLAGAAPAWAHTANGGTP